MKVYAIYLITKEWTNSGDVLQEVYSSKQLAESKILLYSKYIQDKLYVEEVEVLERLNPDL